MSRYHGVAEARLHPDLEPPADPTGQIHFKAFDGLTTFPVNARTNLNGRRMLGFISDIVMQSQEASNTLTGNIPRLRNFRSIYLSSRLQTKRRNIALLWIYMAIMKHANEVYGLGHRDIKPENLLFTHNFEDIFIGDIDAMIGAKLTHEELYPNKESFGTPDYSRSQYQPFAYSDAKLTIQQQDKFAFMLILLEILNGVEGLNHRLLSVTGNALGFIDNGLGRPSNPVLLASLGEDFFECLYDFCAWAQDIDHPVPERIYDQIYGLMAQKLAPEIKELIDKQRNPGLKAYLREEHSKFAVN